MIHLNIRSEVGRLRVVMVHRPGPEVDRMGPGLMGEYLFDDILFGDRARLEHDLFCQVLSKVADEVLEIEDVLAEALSDLAVRSAFLEDLVRHDAIPPVTLALMATLNPRDLARLSIAGLEHPLQMVEHYPSPQLPYIVTPIPNLLFMRDPLVVLHDNAVVTSMARKVRSRESILARYAYAHHPRLRLSDGQGFLFDDLDLHSIRKRTGLAGLEGGDILVLSDRIVAIGISERTSDIAVDMLASELQQRTSVELIFKVLLPHRRAVMHLDTVFTQISEHEALVYPPMFLKDGAELLPAVKLDLRSPQIRSELCDSLLPALAEEGLELEPICCGGAGDRLMQQREQWTDGANALALASGVITLYERNQRTAEELSRHGYEVVPAARVVDGTTPLILDGRHKYVILIPGTELSRARGGPRCMTMPLVREN